MQGGDYRVRACVRACVRANALVFERVAEHTEWHRMIGPANPWTGFPRDSPCDLSRVHGEHMVALSSGHASQESETRATNCREMVSCAQSEPDNKVWSRRVPRRRADYAIAAEDAQEDPYGCFPSCFIARQSRPHISDTPRSSINLRERTAYVPDLVCPPTSVVTFASVTTLCRCLRGGTCARTLYSPRSK